MFRSIVTVFIIAVAVQATFVFMENPRETAILKFTDEDLIQTNPGSYSGPSDIPTYLGTLSAGKHIAGEKLYTKELEHKNNDEKNILELDLLMTLPGTVHFVSAENIGGSEAVVCETANTLGSNRSSIRIRIAPRSTAKLRALIGVH